MKLKKIAGFIYGGSILGGIVLAGFRIMNRNFDMVMPISLIVFGGILGLLLFVSSEPEIYYSNTFKEVKSPKREFTDRDYLLFKHVNRNCNNLKYGNIDMNVNRIAEKHEIKYHRDEAIGSMIDICEGDPIKPTKFL